MSELRLNRARQAMAAHGTDPNTWQFACLADLPNHGRGARSIYRADAPGQASMVLKTYDRRDRAAQVGAHLKILRKKTDHVVRPIFIATDLGVLAMDYVGGQTALDRMQPEGHDLALDTCANWLGRFCDDMAPAPAPFDAHRFARPIVLQGNNLPTSARALLMQVCDRLEAGFDRHADGAVPQLLSFGDVKPSNIVLSDTEPRAIAVDPNHDAGIRPPEFELASLIHWGRLIHLPVAAMDHPLDHGRLALFCDALILRALIRFERMDTIPALRSILLAHITGPHWASGLDFAATLDG